MPHTDHFIRYQHVDSVAETPRGLLAELHEEQLRIDVISAEVVRFTISRGGMFDEAPTFAVCVDPLSGPVDFRIERDEACVRLLTEATHRLTLARSVPVRRAPGRRQPGDRDRHR